MINYECDRGPGRISDHTNLRTIIGTCFLTVNVCSTYHFDLGARVSFFFQNE